MTLPKGKLGITGLERLVFPHLPRVDDSRKVTLDYAATTVEGKLYVASDPVIGIPLQYYGFFAVHYSATDVAMAGAVPQYLNLGIYYPPNTEESWLTSTVQQIGQEAEKLNLRIIGGHTGGYTMGCNFLSSPRPVLVFFQKVYPNHPKSKLAP
jgi:hydrogenase maturation factor